MSLIIKFHRNILSHEEGVPPDQSPQIPESSRKMKGKYNSASEADLDTEPISVLPNIPFPGMTFL